MWLPVMDSKNKAMKKEPYTYQVWDNYSKQYVEKTVNAATMFDINKTIMRTLVKNLSMFGLALYIYAGEDLPESEVVGNTEASSNQQIPQKRIYTKHAISPAPQPKYDPYANIRTELDKANSMNELMALYQKYRTLVDTDPQVKSLFTQARTNLNNVA